MIYPWNDAYLMFFVSYNSDCDSGLAARRLKALQTKLAEELMNKGTSGGNDCMLY
jgi:hypothetical protein